MDPDHLYVEAHGRKDGRTVVLVHGAPDRSGSFRPLLPHLADCHVIVYDRRGYGRSLPARPPTSMLDHAHDLLEILERFPAPRVVVAHSFGSNPTMLAATLRPDAIASVGLWEPPLPWLEWWPESTKEFNAGIGASDDPGEWIEEFYHRLFGDQAWARLPVDVQAKRRAEGVAFQCDMVSELVAPFDVDDVKVPAVVGYGSETSTEHARGAIWLADQLPNGRLHVVEGAAHFGHRTHPVEFAEFTRAALAHAG